MWVTGTPPCPGWSAADPGELAALRDEPSLGVPQVDVLVEPSVADQGAVRPEGERPGFGKRSEVPGELDGGRPAPVRQQADDGGDRKSTRLNSSHVKISYA